MNTLRFKTNINCANCTTSAAVGTVILL